MPPAPRGQRRHQHLPAATGGVGGNAPAPHGDSSGKRCSQHGGRAHRNSRQAGFSRGLGRKDKGGGCSWEKMELQEARGEGLAARGWRGWRGGSAGSRDGGDRRGQEGMEEGGVGGPSAWSWELPARLDSHSLSQPRGFGKPHFFQDAPPKGNCSVWFCSRTCQVAGKRLFQDPFSCYRFKGKCEFKTFQET